MLIIMTIIFDNKETGLTYIQRNKNHETLIQILLIIKGTHTQTNTLSWIFTVKNQIQTCTIISTKNCDKNREQFISERSCSMIQICLFGVLLLIFYCPCNLITSGLQGFATRGLMGIVFVSNFFMLKSNFTSEKHRYKIKMRICFKRFKRSYQTYI